MSCTFLVLFITISCKSRSEIPQDESSTVLVQLKSLDSSPELEIAFKAFDLKEEGIVSRPMKIVLYRYDEKTIENAELVSMLKENELVEESQPNRKVELRN